LRGITFGTTLVLGVLVVVEGGGGLAAAELAEPVEGGAGVAIDLGDALRADLGSDPAGDGGDGGLDEIGAVLYNDNNVIVSILGNWQKDMQLRKTRTRTTLLVPLPISYARTTPLNSGIFPTRCRNSPVGSAGSAIGASISCVSVC
jgi:hypothetical protein